MTQTAIDVYKAWQHRSRGVSITAVCISLLLHGLLLWMLQGRSLTALRDTHSVNSIAVRLLKAPAVADASPLGNTVQQIEAQEPEPTKPERSESVVTELATVERLVATPRPFSAKPHKTEMPRKRVRERAALRFRPPRSAPLTKSKLATRQTNSTTRTNTSMTDPSAKASARKRGLRVTPIYTPAPEYPRLARRLGLEGTVLLRVTLRESGVADDIKVIRSSGHEIFDHSALAAVRKWQFELTGERNPATTPWVDVPIRFTLARERPH